MSRRGGETQLHISSYDLLVDCADALTLAVLLSGTVFIDRKNNKSAIASMTQAGEDMKRKRVSGAHVSCTTKAELELSRLLRPRLRP